MMQYAIIPAYFLAALVLPLIFVFLLWGVSRIAAKRDERLFWSSLIGTLGIIPVLTELRSTRGEIIDGIVHDVWVPPALLQFISEWGARGLTYMVLGLSIITITRNLYKKMNSRRNGGALFSGYLLFVSATFISSVVGTQPSFNHFIFFAPLIFSLAYLTQADLGWQWYLGQFKRILLIYIISSAVFGLLYPAFATGSALVLIPGLNFRVNGIFSHSNTLGLVALAYLVLDRSDKDPKQRFRRLSSLLAWGVLVATQSKTAWAGAVLAYAIFYLHWLYASNRGVNDRANNGFGLLWALVSVLFVLCAVLFVGIKGGAWFYRLDTESYNSLTSLTGRTNIWLITIQSWMDNPIFGYGPGLWDVEYRLRYAPKYLTIAGMAHNQFIQTLGEAGVVGLAGLLTYMYFMFKLGLKGFVETHGMSLALVFVLFSRSLTEAPLRNLSIDAAFFIHIAVFILLINVANNKGMQVVKQ